MFYLLWVFMPMSCSSLSLSPSNHRSPTMLEFALFLFGVWILFIAAIYAIEYNLEKKRQRRSKWEW
jgi:hypothetical protein